MAGGMATSFKGHFPSSVVAFPAGGWQAISYQTSMKASKSMITLKLASANSIHQAVKGGGWRKRALKLVSNSFSYFFMFKKMFRIFGLPKAGIIENITSSCTKDDEIA